MNEENCKKLWWGFGIFVVSVFIGVVVPGGFAKKDRVFFSEQMEATFAPNDLDVTNKVTSVTNVAAGRMSIVSVTNYVTNYFSPRIEKYVHVGEDLSNQLAVVKVRIWDLLTNNPEALTNGVTVAGQTNLALADLITLRSKLETDIAKRKEALVPFYTSQESLLWLDTFFTLGLLAIVFKPGPKQKCKLDRHSLSWFLSCLLPAVCLLAFYKWPSVARHFMFHDPDRVVLYYNTQVLTKDGWSTVVDYLLEYVYCVLMIVIWRQWLRHDETQKQKLENESREIENDADGQKYLAAVLDPRQAKEILNMFLEWIIASVLLGSSFIFDAFFYYGAIADSGDQRYRISALLELTVWAVAWIIISLPLIHAWRHWNGLRQAAMHEARDLEKPEKMEARLKLIEEAQPLSTAVVVVAQVGAVVSFFATVFEQVFK